MLWGGGGFRVPDWVWWWVGAPDMNGCWICRLSSSCGGRLRGYDTLRADLPLVQLLVVPNVLSNAILTAVGYCIGEGSSSSSDSGGKSTLPYASTGLY